jgi:hypothetical protein
MFILFIVVFVIIVVVYLFFRRPQFGRNASAMLLKKIQSSPNYKNHQFQNLSNTPQLTGDAGMFRVMKEFFFNKNERNVPPAMLPSKKTDLFKIDPNENVLVWFGHSSYFMQLDGKIFLIDPVLSGHASPVKFTTRSFKGSDVYTTDDIPLIDFLLITHDHYDHLDYESIVKLKPKIKNVITGLGVSAHLQRWGYDEKIITQMDWNEEVRFENVRINATTAAFFRKIL